MIALARPWPTNPWPTQFRTVRVSTPGALPDGLRFVTVQSPALGGRGDLAIFVPPGLELGTTDLPLVVLLHGVYGSFWNWAFCGGAHDVLSALIEAGVVAPMVLAMPSDGLAGEGTAYLDCGGADYERWVIDDVPACVAEATACIGDRSPLMLGGNSMGGFGALRLSARHAGRVAAVCAHSAITDLDELALFTLDDVGVVVGLPDAERSVVSVIGRHRDVMPPIHVDCGTGDPLIGPNRDLRDALERLGVDHSYEEYDGAHDWPSWRRRLAVSLQFFDRVARATAATGRPC